MTKFTASKAFMLRNSGVAEITRSANVTRSVLLVPDGRQIAPGASKLSTAA
jgi:hypothetical protein